MPSPGEGTVQSLFLVKILLQCWNTGMLDCCWTAAGLLHACVHAIEARLGRLSREIDSPTYGSHLWLPSRHIPAARSHLPSVARSIRMELVAENGVGILSHHV